MKFDHEKLKSFSGLYIGCDEVGRGPLAGPVVGCAAGALAFEGALEFLHSLNITDSKKLNQKKRLAILEQLGVKVSQLKPDKIYELNHGLKFSLTQLDNVVIDEINILNASLNSMCTSAKAIVDSISQVKKISSLCLIDGNKTFKEDNLPFEMVAVVKGDQKSLAIALASIIAKEYRDFLMSEYDKKYPEYGFASHSGYPTKKHKEAIAHHGITAIHRKSFKGVKEFI